MRSFNRIDNICKEDIGGGNFLSHPSLQRDYEGGVAFNIIGYIIENR